MFPLVQGWIATVWICHRKYFVFTTIILESQSPVGQIENEFLLRRSAVGLGMLDRRIASGMNRSH